MSLAIKAENVKNIYHTGFIKRRAVKALNGISLEVKKGEIFGVLGPNGAGKTTLMNILMGLIIPDEGKIEILGVNPADDKKMGLKRRMNMCSGNANFPWCMSVKEILNFYSMIYAIEGRERKRKIEGLIEVSGLGVYRDVRFDELSTGNKQKLSLAKSLLNDPEVLLLDEPTIGLDPDISYKIREYILKLHASTGITIILTTHYMKEAEELCGRIAFIKEGMIKASGTKDELVKLTGKSGMEEVFIELAAEQD